MLVSVVLGIQLLALTAPVSSNDDVKAVVETLSPGWGTAQLIETEDLGNANSPTVAMDSSGNAIVVWHQYDSTNGSARQNAWSNTYVVGVGWGTAELIETGAGDAFWPQTAMDATGNAIAVWTQYDGASYSVWANRYVVGVGWGIAELIETGAGNVWSQQVAMDGTGNAVAVWTQYDGATYSVWTNRYVVGVGWGIAELIQTEVRYALDPQIAVDYTGNAIAVWAQSDGSRNNIWANRYVVGVGWDAAELIETNDAGDARFPQVAVDGTGNAIAVWHQSDGWETSIWANRYVVGVGWGTAELIETDVSDALYPQVAVDYTGNAIVVWHQFDGTRCNIWANRYVVGVGWGIAGLVETNDAGGAWLPQIAVYGTGNAIAVWFQSDGTKTSIWADRYVVGAGWAAPELTGIGVGDAESPRVAVDGTGNAIAVWSQYDGVCYNIWSNRYVVAPPPPPPRTHEVLKGAQGPRASEVTWEYAPSDYGTWIGRIVNNGLRSLLVDVYDITTGVPEEIMHQRIRFAANDAYPYGEVNTSGVVMSPIHRYLITVTPNGPQGSSCVVEDMILRPQSPPIASFTYTIDYHTIDVNASHSYDADGVIESYLWDWGDGSTEDGVTATHTYLHGLYTLTLTVVDNQGLTDTMSAVVYFDGVIIPPVAIFTWTTPTTDWYSVIVDGSQSYDIDGTIVLYAWDFGDGSTATGQTATHSYVGGGYFTITLEVTDDAGLTGVAVQYIQISPVVVSFTYTVIGLTVNVDASGIDSDGAIVSYVWDWGDGATATGMAAVHTYSAGGTYIITLAMTFNDGSIGRISQTLTVEAVPV